MGKEQIETWLEQPGDTLVRIGDLIDGPIEAKAGRRGVHLGERPPELEVVALELR